MGKLQLKMAVISFSLLQLSFPIMIIINVNTFLITFYKKKPHKDQKRKIIKKYSKKKKNMNSDNHIVPLYI